MEPAAGGDMVPLIPPPINPMDPQQQSDIPHSQQYLTSATAIHDDEVRTLWIGDLQYWMDENYLRTCFSTTQEVANVKVMSKKQITMESEEGYGFIEFYTHAAAERVLQTFNGAIMPNGGGQSFKLNWWAIAGHDQQGVDHDSSVDCSIFVGDLASDVTDNCTQQEMLRGNCYPSVKRLTMCSSRKKRLTMCSSSSKKRLTMSSRRWEEWVLEDIMYLIMSKLMVFPIYLARFSAVCKRWHQLVYDSPKLVQQHPLVFVPLVGQKYPYRIDNLMGRHAHPPVHSLPCEFSALIIGSSFGWLIIASVDQNDRSVSLFNPLSKSYIRLPHLLELYPDKTWKGVLSKPPPPRPEEEDQSFDIAITMGGSYFRGYKISFTIAFLHVQKIEEVQSKQWVYHNHFVDKILDISRIGGRICILHQSSIINCYNYSSDTFYNVKKADWPSSIEVGDIRDYDDDDEDDDWVTAHLLESSSSELLVVFRYQVRECCCCCRRTIRFKILTLTSSSIDDKEENWKWTEENDNNRLMMMLGNDAIFLSNDNGDSICIQAAAGSNVAAAGCIYFINDFYHRRCPNGNDIGVFNVGQNCITHFIQHVDVAELLYGPPIWLLSSYDKILKFSNIS